MDKILSKIRIIIVFIRINEKNYISITMIFILINSLYIFGIIWNKVIEMGHKCISQ